MSVRMSVAVMKTVVAIPNDSEAGEVNTDAHISGNDNSREFSTEELLPIKHTDKNIEWYKTKQWSVFISVLTVLAVCWLTTLVFFSLTISQSR